MIHQEPTRTGTRRASAIASCILAASGVALHPLSAGRTAIVRKVHIFNNNGAATIVSLGTGLLGAFAAAQPGWFVGPGLAMAITEEDLPGLEYTANITVAASVAAAAPANVQVQVEVEEFEGPTG